jgi:hypothetical protein
VERVWDCILCVYVNEEGGDGGRTDSETLSLMSHTRRYVSFVDFDRLSQVGM